MTRKFSQDGHAQKLIAAKIALKVDFT